MVSRRKVVCWAIVTVVLVATGALVVCVGSTARHAEFALHGTTLVIMVVEKYVHDHGKWPASWKDLESVSLDPGGRFSWPGGLKELQNIQEFVEVDFSLTLDQVANQRCDDFHAIRPHGTAYSGWERGIPSLLQTVQKARKSVKNEPK